MSVDLKHGDCLEVLRGMADNSVDSIVTDPPYGLSFMGKRWDYDVPSVEVWAECLRVLKPGGHLLAFAGTRTQHRMAVRIEDAGFEIRDMIAWVYGSGFPKSLDVSKAIDKSERGAMVRRKLLHFSDVRGVDGKWLESHGVASASSFSDWTVGGHVPSNKNWELVKSALGVTPEEETAFERAAIGRSNNGIAGGSGKHAGQEAAYGFGAEYDITAPATEAARQWQGWGTALKPALEPITVARKPLIGTVAENVLAHGTGAINVDGCRVATTGEVIHVPQSDPSKRAGVVGSDLGISAAGKDAFQAAQRASIERTMALGRWPANLIHDGSEEVLALAGEQARFFYCAKASKADRGDGNNHPTVKPTDLMRYLCRLVTPPGGTVLDPFTGSGSTGRGAVLEGFRFIGIEREAEYVQIAYLRIFETLE